MNLIIRLSAKCSDCCDIALLDDGMVLAQRDGYVPSFIPEGGGDYIDFDIDAATGQILNWVAPTTQQLNDFVEGTE